MFLKGGSYRGEWGSACMVHEREKLYDIYVNLVFPILEPEQMRYSFLHWKQCLKKAKPQMITQGSLLQIA